MRIGIFGGSFDPIHKFHIEIAAAAKVQFRLDVVYLIPAYRCPGNNKQSIASPQERMEMAELASKDIPWLIPSDMEIKRGEVSYTFDTAVEIQRGHPEDELYLILGSDKLETIENWYRINELLNIVKLIVVCRNKYRDRIQCKFPYEAITIESSDISSFLIRSRIETGKPVSEYLQTSVEDYVYQHGCYFKDTIKEIQEKLRKDVTEKRYRHICAVMIRAAVLAEIHKVNYEKVQLAALLHDCAKNIPKPILHLLADDDTDVENVLHAPAGAVIASMRYNIKDQEILRAIRLHCTGDANMSNLDMLVYLADMTERTRNFPSVENIRKVSENRLEYGMRTALEHMLRYLENSGTDIHPATRKAYEYYKDIGDI